MRLVLAAVILALLPAAPGCAARHVEAVSEHCSGSTNEQISKLIYAHERGPVDNVMVCGTTIAASRYRRGFLRGAHDLLPLRAPLPDGRTVLVEVVANEDLDGRVTAPRGAHVVAYGQYFLPTRGIFVAGIHDVHCATHRGADNGWVWIDGTRYPRGGC